MPHTSAKPDAQRALRLVPAPSTDELTVTTTTVLDPEIIEAVAERVVQLLDARQARPHEESKLLTIPEAATYLRCRSRQRVDDLLSAGRLTRVKDGRRTLVAREELERYLQGLPTGRAALAVVRSSRRSA